MRLQIAAPKFLFADCTLASPAERLAQDLQDAVTDNAKRFIGRNTLVIVDPTDVCKPHSRKMDLLTLVRDASRSTKDNVVKTREYHRCMKEACKSGSRKTVPLTLMLWSPNAATKPNPSNSGQLPKSTSPLFY